MYKIKFVKFILASFFLAIVGVFVPPMQARQQTAYDAQAGMLKVEVMQPEEMRKFRQYALRNHYVGRLRTFVVDSRNYIWRLDAVIATKIRYKNKEVARVILMPYQQKDGAWIGHIAFWTGVWDGISDRGAIATDGGVVIYYPGRDGVRRISADELDNLLFLPLNALVGPTPPWMPEYTVEAQTSTHGRLMSPTWIQVDASITAYTLLGFVAYRFHQVKSWIYDGTEVSNVDVFVYLSDVDPNFVYRGIINQNDSWGPAHRWHDSFRQGHVENCIARYGCIGSTYPFLEIRGTYDGRYSILRWGF